MNPQYIPNMPQKQLSQSNIQPTYIVHVHVQAVHWYIHGTYSYAAYKYMLLAAKGKGSVHVL